jgi:hypothetical protein
LLVSGRSELIFVGLAFQHLSLFVLPNDRFAASTLYPRCERTGFYGEIDNLTL